ncbi:MAG: cupin domain-containing protein [bacterium]|nr:cupin domain-containing protein [bacterium]
MGKPDAKKVQQNWESRGFSFGIFEDPPGRCWEDFVHGEDELFMVLEGKVELEMGKQVRLAEVGEEILIPAGVLHSVRNRGDTPSKWFYGYKYEN